MSRATTNQEFSADRSGQFPVSFPQPPPAPQNAIPFWAKYGYLIVVTCVGVLVTAGSMGFSYHQSLQNEHVSQTRRVDALEYRLDSLQSHVHGLATEVGDLVTKEEFKAETERIHTALIGLRGDLKDINRQRR